MKRVLTAAAALVAVVASFVVTVGIQGSSASSSSHKFAFTVVAQDSEATFTPSDFFSTPPAQNDQVSIDAPVYRSGSKVGLAETIVTITRVGDDTAGIIECSVELPEGNILFNGSLHLADLGTGATIPVVGGTGRYAGASGVVTMVGAADGSSTDLKFRFTTK